MTLRHYQIFVTVCDSASMTAAAGELSMSQSAVSQAVAELEAHYGVRLFERLSRKLYLTRAGDKLLSYARHIVRMNWEAEREMRAWNDTGVVRVGASVTIGACVLPGLAANYLRRNPGAVLEVTEDNTERIERLLVDDRLDLGLVEGEISLTDIVERPFATDELVLIAGRDHPFFDLESVEPAELDDRSFVLREEGSGTRKTFETVMAERGLKWTASWTCNNADTIKAAVAEGLGVSVISRRAVEREIGLGLLREIPVNGLCFQRRFKVVYHRHKFLTGAMEAFIDFCFREGGSMEDAAAPEKPKNPG